VTLAAARADAAGSARVQYQTRLGRFNDAVALKKPDRMPVVSLAGFFVTHYAGLTPRQALYDYEKMAQAWKSTTFRLDWDMAPTPLAMYPGSALEIIGARHYKWPGHDLPDHVTYQFLENEYMRADEYDEFLRNPDGFTLRKLMPRFARALQPLAALPPLYSLISARAFLFGTGMIAGSPAMADAMRTLLRYGEEWMKWHSIVSAMSAEIEEAGYPMLHVASCYAPFDWVSDNLRGMRGSMLDMYRRPDKLLAVMELYAELAIESTIAAAKQCGNPRIFMALHRGAGGFMSDEQFAKFYWPGLRKVLLALIDAGLTPLPYWEGDYTERLHYLADLPRGKVAGHFDIVDLEKCRRVLGDRMCFWGNVPASLLVTGTPQEVTSYVRRLIDLFGDTYGLIVDGAVAGVPDESRPENVEAMVEAVFKYGVYN
jgi:uroporphyrinogen-III decarboxylase